MELVKRIWHDPVWSKVIAAAILFGASRLVRYWPPNLLANVNHWFDTPITLTLTRGDLVNWPLLAASMGLSLYTIVLGIRRTLMEGRNARQGATEKRPPAPAPTGAPISSVTLAPRLPESTQSMGLPAPTMVAAGVAGPTLAGGVAPTIAPAGAVGAKPVELADTEAAVLRWCGHHWQPGIPVGIARGALEIGLSALQVAHAVDGLHSRGLVSKIGPNGALLTPAGRELCIERGWHGGLEAARRRDPRSPSVP